MPTSIAAAQVPAPGELNVDHVAHFVPKMDNARLELERLGFKVTPFSSQSHRTQPDHPLEPAGAGNCCVMLERGYLAGGGFNPTMAHQPRHVAGCLDAAAEVFPEISEAIARDDVLQRIDGQVKHATFARLTG